jgi:hypothetical protein
MRTRPEPLFLSYLERERWQQICDTFQDPEERGAALLRVMGELAPKVLSHEAAVREVFRRYYQASTGCTPNAAGQRDEL